jgi:hypothetical protein
MRHTTSRAHGTLAVFRKSTLDIRTSIRARYIRYVDVTHRTPRRIVSTVQAYCVSIYFECSRASEPRSRHA